MSFNAMKNSRNYKYSMLIYSYAVKKIAFCKQTAWRYMNNGYHI